MAKRGVGFRIPEAWYEEIRRICDRQGISVSEFLTEVVAEALQKEDNADNKSHHFQSDREALEKRLDSVEKMLSALMQRLTVLENQAPVTLPFAQPLTSNPVNWDDLPDDEPDEILTDFLEP